MRILPVVTPTPEQLPILLENQPGALVIRGAAGSGKTTTALLRLQNLCLRWLARKRRLGLIPPVRVLVLTYNKTLEGYIRALAEHQVAGTADLAGAVASGELEVTVKTFGKFAQDIVGAGVRYDEEVDDVLARLLPQLGLPVDFLRDEVDYVLGRFAPADLEDYVGIKREGRGASPRMEAATRRRLLDEIIFPYQAEKDIRDLADWNDLAIEAGTTAGAAPWDVVIVDEAQDFSANQVRTVLRHLAADHSITFVMDAAQRIYPRSFKWSEVGIEPSFKSLTKNHRNTKQIAAFARSLIDGMAIGDDGTLPDFDAADQVGALPSILVGKFSGQMSWTMSNVVARANLADESVAFLHPLGGGWFSYVKQELSANSVPFVQLTRASTWPGGAETVALSTIHSAKGLEFDHVIILGLNQQVTPHGDEEGDAKLESLRRLLAMGIGRARKSVTLGFKDGAGSTLVGLLDASTYTAVRV